MNSPILQRIIDEEQAVKRIISNTIEGRNVKQSSYLDADDIYQDIALLALDYDKISKRMGNINKYFYGSIKMLAIDFILKEQRRLHKFRMSPIQTIRRDKNGNVTFQIGYRHHKKLSHPSFAHTSVTMLTIQQTLSDEDMTILDMHLQGYTLKEIAQKIGLVSCQYRLDKIKRILRQALSY